MEFSPGTTVDARFREIATCFADRPALRHRSTINYRALDRRSDEFASQLIPAPAVVGIALADPVEIIAAMLGVLKAGRAYTLIDPVAPLPRQLAIVEEMAIDLVVGDAATGPWPGYRGRWLDPRACSTKTGMIDFPRPATDGAAACSIVQTSGSTGQPRGVEVSHAALLQTIGNYAAFARITPDDRLTMLTSAAHFAAHSAIFGALLNGACLCVFDVRSEGLPAMADWLESEQLTIYQSPPSLFRAFCQQMNGARQFPAMRLVRLGGEPASLRDFHLFQKHFSAKAEFVNALGISEAAGNVAYFFMDPTTDLPGAVLPVGSIADGRDVFLADASGAAVRAGETGEIIVRSDFLATGYYRRPDLTVQKFRISPVDGRRELLTGDLGHFTPQGWLMHDGRKDNQVKIRGHRVDIGGLESALCSLAAVEDARVLKRQSDDEADDLIAFVVPAGSGITAEIIHRQLSELVMATVLPRILILDQLPLNPGGKINRKRLLELAAGTVTEMTPGIPFDTTQGAVTAIWESVLKIGEVGVDDDFFGRGGDSLKALSVMAALEARFAIKLSPKRFLEHPTIAEMARYIQAGDADQSSASVMVFEASGDSAPFYFLHGDWRGGFYCSHLASHIVSAHPFCVVPPHRSLESGMVSLPTMATEHLAVIRQRTPQGPYVLGGYCIGAVVAAEIARQLVAQGEQVTGLLLIDPSRSASPWLRGVWTLVDRIGEVLQWTLRKKINCVEFYGMAVVRWSRKSTVGKFASLCRRTGWVALADRIKAEDEIEEIDAEIYKRLDYAVYVLANRIYRPRRVAVATTIYLPEDRPPPSRSWTRLMRRIYPYVVFQRIPGDHRTCLSEHGNELGTRLKKTLEELAQASER